MIIMCKHSLRDNAIVMQTLRILDMDLVADGWLLGKTSGLSSNPYRYDKEDASACSMDAELQAHAFATPASVALREPQNILISPNPAKTLPSFAPTSDTNIIIALPNL